MYIVLKSAVSLYETNKTLSGDRFPVVHVVIIITGVVRAVGCIIYLQKHTFF